MFAIVNARSGPPEVLEYREIADPVPGPGDILIDVHAISIEGGDLISRRMSNPEPQPHVIGYQAAGVVLAIGAEVQGFAAGDRAATFNFKGSHAQQRVVPANLAWRVPDGLPIDAASTVPVTFGTAHEAVVDLAKVSAGESVLVQGGAGGVGVAAIQIAKSLGAKVFATSSSDANLEALKPLGLDVGINYTRGPIDEAVMAATDGVGVDAVIDLVGGDAFASLMAATRPGGRVVTTGFASGKPASADLMTIMLRRLTVTGSMFGLYMTTDANRAMIADYLNRVAAGEFSMPIHARFALADAVQAHRCAENDHPLGRVILEP